MMQKVRIAYVMQCHKNPHQINRVLSALTVDGDDVYVHVDRKSTDIKKNIQTGGHIKILPFEESVDVKWSDITQVEATLALCRKVLESGKEYDYIWLVSGQDYPIKERERIEETLSMDKDKAFINASATMREGAKRNELYYPRWMLKRNQFIRIIKKAYVILTGGVGHTFKIFKRKQVFDQYYFGSSWWCLPYNCIKEILEQVDNDPKILKFFKNTVCADECFFQTLVKRSSYADKVVHNLTYVDWSNGGSSPKTLTIQDKEKLLSDDKYLHARKFDEAVDAEIIDFFEERYMKIN